MVFATFLLMTFFIHSILFFMSQKIDKGRLKDVYNKIVGFWYAEKKYQVLVFSLVENYFQPSFLKVIEYGVKETTTVYNIGITMFDELYFELGYLDTKPVYIIESITPQEMIISNEQGEAMRYTRLVNDAFVERVLQLVSE